MGSQLIAGHRIINMEKDKEFVGPPPYPTQQPGMDQPQQLGQQPYQYGAQYPRGQNQYGAQPTNALGQSHVVVVTQAPIKNLTGFGPKPVITTCTYCGQQVKTIVNDKIKQEGWLWCILCSCFFSWIIGLLACCMDGFKEFSHRCPKCNRIITKVEPKLTATQKTIIIALVVVILFISIGVAVYWWYVTSSGTSYYNYG